jgi:hypothetical protein
MNLKQDMGLVTKIFQNIVAHQELNNPELKSKLGVDGKAFTAYLGGGALAFSVSAVPIEIFSYNRLFQKKHKPKIFVENVLGIFRSLHELGIDQTKNFILTGKIFLLDFTLDDRHINLVEDSKKLFELEKFVYGVTVLFKEKNISKEIYLFYTHKIIEILLDQNIDFTKIDLEVKDNDDDFSPIMIILNIDKLSNEIDFKLLDKTISKMVIADRRLPLSEKMKIVFNIVGEVS